MAGAAAKKTAKNAQSKSRYYSALAVGGSVINLILTVGLFDRSLWTIIISSFLAFVSWLSFSMIRSALELGVGYDLWQDLFVINFIVQIGSLWSRWFWVVYLVVPGYGIYQLGGKLLNWIFTPRESDAGPVQQKKRRWTLIIISWIIVLSLDNNVGKDFFPLNIWAICFKAREQTFIIISSLNVWA